MDQTQSPISGWFILMTLFAAFVLTIIPLPAEIEAFRPEWVALAVTYWCLAQPQRVGVGVAWLLGMMLDAVQGVLLGQHALGMTLIAYFVVKFHQRIRAYPLWQQLLIVLVLIVLYKLLTLWIMGILGRSPDTWLYWSSALSSMLLWPWLSSILRSRGEAS